MTLRPKGLLYTVIYTLSCLATTMTPQRPVQAASKTTEQYRTTIKFDSDSAILSDGDKARLRDIVKDAAAQGIIVKAKVIAWSDKPLPAKDEKLSDKDENLAKNRAQTVSNFLKNEAAVPSVDTYNMAQSSNWLAGVFHTEEAKLKDVFHSKAPVNNEEFRAIKAEGAPTSAVIIIEHKRKI
jgi:hypothetical protein